MAKSNPTRPGAPADESSLDHGADLLDVALDDQPGDVDADGRSCADDVRSDTISDDEARERR